MSVLALRVKRLGDLHSPGERRTFRTLRELRALLEAACIEGGTSRHGDIYTEVVLLALVLVNGALSSCLEDSSYDDLAHQAAVIALSIATSMQYLLQDVGSADGGGWKFAISLSPQLESMTRCLQKASADLTDLITSTSYSTYFRRSGIKVRTERSLRELHALYDSFSFKVSLFIDNQSLTPKRPGDVLDHDGLILKWCQVDRRKPYEAATPSPAHARQNNFWKNTYEAQIDGKGVIVKTYPHKSLKNFRRDLKLLRTNRQNYLPSLFGFSERDAPTPFIAIAMESFLPFFEYLPMLCRTSPQSALGEVWEMLIAMRSTIEYLDNNRMIESMTELTEILENAVVDNTRKVVMAPRGLPDESASTLLELEHPLGVRTIAMAFDVIYENYQNPLDPFVIDHLPRMLRPLRYALIGSPDVMLHTSPLRFGDSAAQERALRHWRPAPDGSRSISWPIACDYEGRNPPPAVGDIGRFSRHPNGQLFFLRHANMQREIGGYILDDQDGTKPYQERFPRNTWRIPFWRKRQSIKQFIPESVALNFLSVNAERIARRYGTPPVDLVLVTATDQIMRWDEEETFEEPIFLGQGFELVQNQEEDNATFVYIHFDDQGHLLLHYQSSSPTPLTLKGSDPTAIVPILGSSPVRIQTNHPPQFIQIEEDELQLPQDSTQSGSATSFKLGDIGCFSTNADGARAFNVFYNAANDLVDVELQPWERNECEDIGAGVWRSPRIHFTEETTVCFSWSMNASINLPFELERFYVYFVASEGGTKAIPPGGDLQMVTQVYHQVQATYSPQDDGLPLRLFVHFDESRRPQRSYWSQIDEPTSCSEEPTRWPGCTSRILPSVSNTPKDRQSSQIGFDHQYCRITDHAHSDPSAKTQSDRRLGDVGIWIKDSEGNLTNQWRNLGRIVSPSSDRQVIYSHQQAGIPCTKISNDLWRARIPREYPTRPTSLDPQWTAGLPHISSHTLSGFVALLAGQYGVSSSDITVVSKIVTNVRASATSEALKHGDGFMSMAEYLADNDAQEFQLEPGSTLGDYANLELPEIDVNMVGLETQELPAEEADGEDWEDEDLNISHDLKLYVVLPSSGGCHAFWSSYELEKINSKALSRLDLQGWQMPGCQVQITLNIERTPLLDLCGDPNEVYSNAMTQDDGSERVDYGLELE